ncbi:hypothetical protein KR093_007289, partial [Drosophila rubida]
NVLSRPQCAQIVVFLIEYSCVGISSAIPRFLFAALQSSYNNWTSAVRGMASLNQMHRSGPHVKTRPPRQPLDGKPFAKGVVLKTLIKKPKKPNSANRKCALVRLSTGKEMVAYIPGIGHNLQEHNIVLCRVGRLQDVPGVKLKAVRGVYDLAHVIKKGQ